MHPAGVVLTVSALLGSVVAHTASPAERGEVARLVIVGIVVQVRWRELGS